MELIKDKKFGGERPLFAMHDLRLENVTITDGESGIKQCQNMEAYDCKFYGKYPWWHVDGAYIENCYFALDSRSAIWYTNDLVMKNSRIDGPKFFREMKNLELENVGAPIRSCSPRISILMDWKAIRSMYSNIVRMWKSIMPRS